MKNIFQRVLLAAVLILLGLTVYNNKVIEAKNSEVIAIQEKQKNTQESLDRISKQLSSLTDQIELANQSYKDLTKKLEVIDKKKNNYTEEVRKIKDASEGTKQFLDTKLPADVKRLLDDAISQ